MKDWRDVLEQMQREPGLSIGVQRDPSGRFIASCVTPTVVPEPVFESDFEYLMRNGYIRSLAGEAMYGLSEKGRHWRRE